MEPLAGSAVVASTPARRKATLLTVSILKNRLSNTGCWSVAASISARVGTRFSARNDSFQPSPIIHCPGGVFLAAAATKSRISLSDLQSSSEMRVILIPTSSMWLCESLKPGMTVAPLRLIILVPTPANGKISRLLPVATTRPCRQAIASTMGLVGSSVMILALWMMRLGAKDIVRGSFAMQRVWRHLQRCALRIFDWRDL